MDVLVAGAGPTGLTAGLELVRLGHRVTVVERREGPSRLSRAVGITAATMALLDFSGVADQIKAEAVSFDGFRVHDAKGGLIAALPLNFDDRSRLWGLAQDRTEGHLRDAFEALGGTLTYGAPLTDFTQDARGVSATYGDRTRRHDWLIGADGVHSTVRQHLGLPYDGFDLPGQWSIADVDATGWPHPKSFQAWLLERGQVVIVAPLEAQRFRVIASTANALAALPVPMTVATLRRAGSFTISVRQVPSYCKGRVLLAGDAAHCHSPAGGRGMNLGIADAAEAAQRLHVGTIEGYSASRHAEGAHVIGFSERARRTVMAQDPLKRALVQAAMRLAGKLPPLARIAMHQLASG